MHTVVETPAYLSDAERFFTVEERAAVVQTVASDPRIGVLVPGTGGLRKLRFGLSGRGKRGGARVVYVFAGEDLPVFLLAAFAKNERSDLTAAERSALARATEDMVTRYRRQR